MGKSLTEKQVKKYEKSFDKLIRYAERNGFDVQLGSGYVDEIHEHEGIIRLNTRYRIDQQFFGLAHELGHYLIRRDQKKFEKDYPLRACRATSHIKKSRAYAHQEIKEEYEAWKRGKALINRMNLFYIEKDFDKSEVDCVYSYIKHAR